MKRLLGLLVLFGMLSITGFGMTNDLAENSITVDYDVGVSDTVLVKTNVLIKEANLLGTDYTFDNHPYILMVTNSSINLKQICYLQIRNIDLMRITNTDFEAFKLIFKHPRDSLKYRWA